MTTATVSNNNFTVIRSSWDALDRTRKFVGETTYKTAAELVQDGLAEVLTSSDGHGGSIETLRWTDEGQRLWDLRAAQERPPFDASFYNVPYLPMYFMSYVNEDYGYKERGLPPHILVEIAGPYPADCGGYLIDAETMKTSDEVTYSDLSEELEEALFLSLDFFLTENELITPEFEYVNADNTHTSDLEFDSSGLGWIRCNENWQPVEDGLEQLIDRAFIPVGPRKADIVNNEGALTNNNRN